MGWLRCLMYSFCLTLLLSSVSFAAAPARINVSLRDVIATVEDAFKPDRNTGTPPLEDVTADFMQRSTLVEKGREMRADGEMFFRTGTQRDPLMFRFDYFRPAPQQIISNGRTMWTYLPANRQVIQSDVSFIFNPYAFDVERTRAANFLQGLGRISKDFHISFSSQMQDVEGNYILELEPRRSMDTIMKLFIVVSREAVLNKVTRVDVSRAKNETLFPLRSSTVIDREGNSTVMEFSNIRANTRIPFSYFTFDIPPDAQVVMPPTAR